jgi:hypothetical protein
MFYFIFYAFKNLYIFLQFFKPEGKLKKEEKEMLNSAWAKSSPRPQLGPAGPAGLMK